MMNTKQTEKMYLTESEAKDKGLPSNEEQIAQWNRIQAEIRARRNADAMISWLANEVQKGRAAR